MVSMAILCTPHLGPNYTVAKVIVVVFDARDVHLKQGHFYFCLFSLSLSLSLYSLSLSLYSLSLSLLSPVSLPLPNLSLSLSPPSISISLGVEIHSAVIST